MLNKTINILIFCLVILVVGYETSLYWQAQLRPWQPSSAIDRVIFYYSFFTVLSNLTLAGSCLWLLIKPDSNSLVFNVFRLNGLLGILLTALIYNLMLRGIHRPPTELLRLANEMLHVVIPLLGLLGWFCYGPFARIRFNVVMCSFICLVMYGVYIFVRGYYSGRYPYPFINVDRIGYEKSLQAVIGVAILFWGLALLLWCIERVRVFFWPPPTHTHA